MASSDVGPADLDALVVEATEGRVGRDKERQELDGIRAWLPQNGRQSGDEREWRWDGDMHDSPQNVLGKPLRPDQPTRRWGYEGLAASCGRIRIADGLGGPSKLKGVSKATTAPTA